MTAVGPNGYWLQSTTPDDGDIATMEGLFVYTNKADITIAVGDDVSVNGSISEYHPGGNPNLTTTELTGPKVTVLSSGNTLPVPVVLGVDRIAPQQVIETPVLTHGGLQCEITKPQSNNQLAVSTFNVEDLAPGDPQIKFDRLAGQVVNNLKSPDIMGLEEIQDNSGAVNDGTVDSTQTTDKLIAAIVAAGGPAYTARWVNPQDLTDGGAPGGNIRQVFFYRADRDVAFVDAPAGDATTAESLTMIDGKPHLALNPGRITPINAAWDDSRKPLVGEFTFRGKTVFVIANHFSSKGGDDPLFGKWQQPVLFSEEGRHPQAQEVRSFLDELLAADPGANVVVLGDINDFEFGQTVDITVGSGSNAIVDLPRMSPVNERYSYVYKGNSQVLDQILIGRALTIAPPGAMYPAYDHDIVHTNSEFYDQDSDHDPQVVRLAIRGGIG